MLETHDLPATLRFYTEILSFNFDALEYGMKEFAIYDNNGYLLQFEQQVLSFEP